MNGREIEPGIWHWEEDYRVYCTLVQGERLAILWDTGQGKQDLSAWVAAQVSTPCIVCNSHGHSDHIGGNFRFPLVYAHPADWPLLAAQARLTGRDWSARPLEPGSGLIWGTGGAGGLSGGAYQGVPWVCFWRERLLLAGDALNPTLLMLGPEAGSFSQLRRTLAAAEAMPFDRYLASHTPGPLRKKQVGLHLRHLDHLQQAPSARPGPYGSGVCRSQHREAGGRSVIFFDQSRWQRPD
ncbi:MAG: MBL fold metallo-hydrolase [Evtepia gabavorous]